MQIGKWLTRKTAATIGAALFGLAATSASAQFTPGDIVALKVQSPGTSSAAGTISLVELAPDGSLVNTIAVPSSGTSAVTIKLSATTEGLLSLSPDGRYVTFAGYRADVGTANPGTSTTINRAIGRLDVTNGALDTSTDFLAYTGDSIRSAVTNNGTNFWLGGAGTAGDGGLRYLDGANYGTSNAPTVAITHGQGGNPNTRPTYIYEGQLYMGTSSTNPGNGIAKVGDGLPTTDPQTYTSLTTTNSQAFFFADLSPTVGYNGGSNDTLYSASTSGLAKFSYHPDTQSWVANGTAIALTNTLLDIAGTTSGSTVTVYGSSTTVNDVLYKLVDTAGYDTAPNGTWSALANAPLAGVNTEYRGLVVLVPEPTGLCLLGFAAIGLLRRGRRNAA